MLSSVVGVDFKNGVPRTPRNNFRARAREISQILVTHFFVSLFVSLTLKVSRWQARSSTT